MKIEEMALAKPASSARWLNSPGQIEQVTADVGAAGAFAGVPAAVPRPPAHLPGDRRRWRRRLPALGRVGVTDKVLGGVFAGRAAACFARASATIGSTRGVAALRVARV